MINILANQTVMNTELEKNPTGVFADTGYLYAISDVDDRLNEKALALFEATWEREIPIYMNVVSRMEFIDLLFRRIITIGALKLFEELRPTSRNLNLFKFLKNVRDENTSQRRAGKSFKLPENRIKKLRTLINDVSASDWHCFCEVYVGKKLLNEWQLLEDELQLAFVETMESETSELIFKPLEWRDMVELMGSTGLRAQDAMIVNIFECSRIPILITNDSDIVHAMSESARVSDSKTVFHLI